MQETIAELVVGLSLDAARFQSGLAQATTGAGQAGGFLQRAFAVATGGLIQDALTTIATTATGAMSSAITSAGAFEAGLNRLASVAGSSLAEAGLSLDDAKQKALDLGMSTAFSAAEAQAAMIELAKGGLPITDVLGTATDATLSLAAAGEVKLASAAEIVAKQLGVWGDAAGGAGNVADQLAQAANASTVGVEDLALGLANVGKVGQVAGVEFNDLVQTMGLIAPGFSSSSDAGTSLKAFLNNLIPTTDKATEAMIDLGLATADGSSAFYDSSGSFIGMEQAAQLLQTATADLSEEQRSLALETIFGSDAQRAAAIIAEQGATGFTAMGTAMAQAGTAAEQAKARNQGFAFALDEMYGSLETLGIVVGTAVLPALTSFIQQGVTPAINAVLQLAQTGDASGLINLFPPGLQPLVASVVTGIQAAVPVIQNIAGALLDAGPASSEFFQALSVVTGDTIAGAIVGVAAGVQQVVAALSLAAGGDTSGLLALFPPELQPIVQTVIGALQTAAPVIQQVVAALTQAAGGDTSGLLALFPPELQASITSVVSTLGLVGGAVVQIAGLIAANAPSVAGSMLAMFGTAFDVVSQIWPPILAIVTTVVGQVVAFLSANGPAIATTWASTWEQVSTIVQTALAIVQTTVIPALAAIAGVVTAHGAEIQQALAGAWQIVSTIVQTALATIQGILTAALALIQGDWQGAWTAIVGVAEAQITAIVGILEGGGAMFDAAIRTSADAILGVWRWLAGLMPDVGRDIVLGVVNGVSSAGSALYGALTNLATNALNAAKNALGIHSPSAVAAAEIGEPLGQGVAVGVAASTPEAAAAATAMAESVTNAAVGATRAGADDVRAAVEHLVAVYADAGAGSAEWDEALGAALERARAVGPDAVAAVENLAATIADAGAGSAEYSEAMGLLNTRLAATAVQHTKLAEAQRDFARKREDLERDHQERMAEIMADGAEKAAEATKAFQDAQGSGRLGFYKSLKNLATSDDAGDQALAAQMSAAYESAATTAAQLAQTAGGDVAKAYLEASRESIREQASLQQEIADARDAGEDTAYLENLLRMQQEYDAARLAEIQASGSAIAAAQAEQLAEEEARYAEAQAKLDQQQATKEQKLADAAAAKAAKASESTIADAATLPRPSGGGGGALGEATTETANDIVQAIVGTSARETDVLERVLTALSQLAGEISALRGDLTRPAPSVG